MEWLLANKKVADQDKVWYCISADMIMGTELYLSPNADEADYKQITQEEKLMIEQRQNNDNS